MTSSRLSTNPIIKSVNECSKSIYKQERLTTTIKIKMDWDSCAKNIKEIKTENKNKKRSSQVLPPLNFSQVL